MIYIDEFYFATPQEEDNFFSGQRRTCYDSFYPFAVLPEKGLSKIKLSDVTILYGGNGSGKTTVLNIIANKIGAERMAPYNKSNFYNDYIELCEVEYANNEVDEKRIIASDDIFDYMIDIRQLNESIDSKREERFEDYLKYKYTPYKLKSMDDIDELRLVVKAQDKRGSQSKYVRQTLIDNVKEYSNGESAFRYFANGIKENGIYILDEPENSLSPKMQLELIKFIEDSVRHFRCQFIIATHSPFVLSMEDALIYDMDQEPVCKRDWHMLENLQTYYDFFMKHADGFEMAKCELEKERLNKVLSKEDDGLSKTRRRLKEKLVYIGVVEKNVNAIMAMIQEDSGATEMLQYIPQMPVISCPTAEKEVAGILMEKAYLLYMKSMK